MTHFCERIEICPQLIQQEHTMQIAIELPNDFVSFLGASQVQKEISISYALWLYQQSRVTLAKAAQIAGLDIYEFMSVCKANHIPTLDINPEDLAQELSELHRFNVPMIDLDQLRHHSVKTAASTHKTNASSYSL
jgi:predicted HTH domain antitoxin